MTSPRTAPRKAQRPPHVGAVETTSTRATEKAATHARIVASASKLIRRSGLAAASVPRVMRGAGLTVGGFYAHFRSKKAMDAEVLRKTLSDVRARWLEGLETSAGMDWMARAVKRYLSTAHRDRADDGCPFPAVLSELARADAGTRNAVIDEFERTVEAFAAHAPVRPGVTARERALATLALCVGGLAIARAFRGDEASDDMLRACVKWALADRR